MGNLELVQYENYHCVLFLSEILKYTNDLLFFLKKYCFVIEENDSFLFLKYKFKAL